MRHIKRTVLRTDVNERQLVRHVKRLTPSQLVKLQRVIDEQIVQAKPAWDFGLFEEQHNDTI